MLLGPVLLFFGGLSSTTVIMLALKTIFVAVINSYVLLPSHSIFWFLGLAENLSLKRIVEPGFYRGVFWGI